MMKKQTFGFDRLSALPDAIIFYIFSSLDVKVLFQLSILSNRWRYLWKSTPFLNFHLDICKKPKKINRYRFINFVDRLFLLRSENCSIHTFNLCSYENLEADRIYTWVIGALKLNVQELYLYTACSGGSIQFPQNFLSDGLIQLPHSLYTSKTIRQLKLEILGPTVTLPETIFSNHNITSLDLASVRFPEGNSNGELVLSFVVLKNLVMRGCCFDGYLKSFTVSAPLLERLEVASLFRFCKLTITIKICTPKLKSLMYTGFIYGDYSLENFSGLVNAELYVWERPVAPEGRLVRYVSNVLSGVYNVKKLLLPTWVVKTIIDTPSISKISPNQFPNLRWMRIDDWGSINKMCIKELSSFVGKISHLETFVWQRYSDEMELGVLSEGDNFKWVNSSLKTIKIRQSLGSEDELRFLEILLEKSLALKEIIIATYGTPSPPEFRKKLLDLIKPYSSVRVSFSSSKSSF